MKNIKDKSRLAYCKNSDVVNELKYITKNMGDALQGGPLHYIATVVNWQSKQPTLILGRQNRNALFQKGDVFGRVFQRKYLSYLPFASKLGDSIVFFQMLFHLLKYRPNKILCSPSGGPLWAAFIAARIYSARLVHTRHARVEQVKGSLSRRLTASLTNWVIRHADAVICHGPYLEKQLLEIGVDPTRLYQFNLSYDYLLDNKTTKHITTQNYPSRYLLFVGRMETNKGIFDLFHALKEKLNNHSSLQLVYAGDGPDLEALRGLIKKNSLETQVQTLGFVEHNTLPELIYHSLCVVLPTRIALPESRCKSAIESLVLGKPVIAPNTGPFPYVIDNEMNGLLFQPDSVKDLQRQLARILDDKKLFDHLTTGAQNSYAKLAYSSFNFRDALNAAFNFTEEELTRT